MSATHRQLVLAAAALICVVVTASRLPANAQDAKKPDELTKLDFWRMNAGLEIEGAISVIGAGDGLGAILARVLAGDESSPLVALDVGVGKFKWKLQLEEPPPLPDEWLSKIRDREPFPDVRGVKLKGAYELAWYFAYCKALEYSNRPDIDLDKFKKGAEPNQHVLFHSLMTDPKAHRGEIITVRGELKVVRKVPTPHRAALNQQFTYTGYIDGPTPRAAPFVIAFSELPDEIKDIPPHQWEKLSLDVTFYGYFLSLVRFPAEPGMVTRNDTISPYLVGRSLIVHGKARPAPAPAVAEGSYSYPLILSAVGVIVGVFVAGALLNVWLRRGDRRTQLRLAEVRDKHIPFNVEPADPEPPVEG